MRVLSYVGLLLPDMDDTTEMIAVLCVLFVIILIAVLWKLHSHYERRETALYRSFGYEVYSWSDDMMKVPLFDDYSSTMELGEFLEKQMRFLSYYPRYAEAMHSNEVKWHSLFNSSVSQVREFLNICEDMSLDVIIIQRKYVDQVEDYMKENLPPEAYHSTIKPWVKIPSYTTVIALILSIGSILLSVLFVYLTF